MLFKNSFLALANETVHTVILENFNTKESALSNFASLSFYGKHKHRHPKQKELFKCYDAVLKKSNLCTFILCFSPSISGFSICTEPETVTWWHLQSTSKKVIWPKKFLNYMHELKSAILAFGMTVPS